MQVDARDLFSPKPTVMALEALTQLKQHETLAVLVNDGKAVDELMHLAEERDCGFSLESEGDYSVVTLAPRSRVKVVNPLEEALRLMGITPNQAPVYLFGSDSLGAGNQEVGRILATEVLYDLGLQEDLPGAIVFYNSGVNLLKADSPAVQAIQDLIDLGVEILADSVSVEAYGLEDGLACGEVVDPYVMVAVVSAQRGVISF